MNCGRREYQRREKFSASSQSYNGLKYRYILPGKSSGEDTVCKKNTDNSLQVSDKNHSEGSFSDRTFTYKQREGKL